MRGIVFKSTGSWYFVRDESGKFHQCRMKGKFRLAEIKNTNPIAVGDVVDFEIEEGKENSVVTKIHPRKNYIIRKSTNLSKQTHIIASNIDQAVIIATVASPRTSFGFIDRFLITAEAYSIPALIVFNKSDLYENESKDLLKEYKAIYEKIGYRTITISVLKNENLEEIKNILKDKTTLIAGHSGVGKSSLINNLQPKLNLKTGDISVAHSKGIHTTTFAEMHELSIGGFVIDTPGIKEFGIIDFEKQEVSHFFPEMRELMNSCKFNNCLHINEPNCAVIKNVNEGNIAVSRYETYLNIMMGDELKKEYE